MQIGNRKFDTEHDCYVMGILNITPDSFSDGGKWNDLERAKQHTADMISQGAAIIDVGGESTRPGHQPITVQEEIERIVPIITMIKQCFNIPVSIDTYKSAVAKAALEAGADLVNDIWGLRYDPNMAPLIAKYQVSCCLMHNRNKPDYHNFLSEVCEDLKTSVSIAKAAGISDAQIILDPGVGFGKTYIQNLTILHHLEKLNELGYPVLLAASRKSVIGLSLDLPAEERLEGTLATTVLGVLHGAAFVRVHDVAPNLRAIRMTQAILQEEKPHGLTAF